MPQKSTQAKDKNFVVTALFTLQEELKEKIAKMESGTDSESLSSAQKYQVSKKVVAMMDSYVYESDVLLGSRSKSEAETHRAMERSLSKKVVGCAMQSKEEFAGLDNDATIEKLEKSGKISREEAMFIRVFMTDTELRVGRGQMILEIEGWVSSESNTRPFEHRPTAQLRKQT